MKHRSFLLGLGFDGRDGHKRITRGENFYIFGGSKNTHQKMREGCVKINEELKKRHKSLDEVSHKEFYKIAYKVGLKVYPPEDKKRDK